MEPTTGQVVKSVNPAETGEDFIKSTSTNGVNIPYVGYITFSVNMVVFKQVCDFCS